MSGIPDKLYIACGCSAALLVVGFFLVGAHHEFSYLIRHRLRQRRRGGFLIGGDR